MYEEPMIQLVPEWAKYTPEELVLVPTYATIQYVFLFGMTLLTAFFSFITAVMPAQPKRTLFAFGCAAMWALCLAALATAYTKTTLRMNASGIGITRKLLGFQWGKEFPFDSVTIEPHQIFSDHGDGEEGGGRPGETWITFTNTKTYQHTNFKLPFTTDKIATKHLNWVMELLNKGPEAFD